MRRTTRAATTLTVAALGLVGGGLQVTAIASPAMDLRGGQTGAARGVCEGVRDCSVVGRFDVNGDGRKDRVGLVNHDRDGYIRDGHVTLRVKTARGRIVRQRVAVTNWRGPVWHGRAAINGRRGNEIVLGGNRRKYTTEGPGDTRSFSKGFHVVTFRPGSDLGTERAPEGSRLWWLTSPDGVRSGGGSARFYHEWGWWRKTVHGQVRIQKRWLSTGGAAGVRSKKIVWVWRDGQWRRRSSGPVPDPLGKRYGGWHARGLPVW
jgi:hypothetical protein